MKKIVTIGGGSGHSQVLKALKNIPDVQITGICPSTDSGGSTGVLQREYDGNGYTGDLTKCIVSLCGDEILAKALSYKYKNGPIHSHSVKNLLLHALEKVEPSEKALETMWKICGLGVHRILPVTKEKVELCAYLGIGNTISGETNIDTIAKNPLWNPSIHSISEIYLKPEVKATKLSIEAVKQADYIVVCPGDLYSSIIPVLLPKGMKESIKKSKTKIILILNIMTKKGETDNYTATDFVEKIEEHLGRKADYILYNNAKIPKNILLRYSLEQKVELGFLKNSNDSRVIEAPLVMISETNQVYSDPKIIKKIIQNILKNDL
ncbi:YvcK family protein [Candidatus Pacearchaeota archaeon]|nr:YvcK family protein [Candidatus Pacearchaeota archaeon]